MAFLAEPNLREEVFAYIGGVSNRLKCPTIAVGGFEDHVHILAALGRTTTIAEWVKETKRVSNQFAKDRIEGFAWQSGYAAFSVDPASMGRIAAYVRGQEAHHAKVSFQDELRTLLKQHNLEWDEQHLWD